MPGKKINKKSNGEGSIFQRTDGRWYASIQVGTNDEGKPIRKNFYAKQRKEVLLKLNEYKFKLQSGEVISISKTLDEIHFKLVRSC